MQRIALVALNRLDGEAFCYALNACQRMGARLDILTNLPPEEINLAVIAKRGAVDTPWRVIRIGANGAADVLGYAQCEPALLFLASGVADETAHEVRDKFALAGTRLGVPWVVVEGKPIHP